MDGQYIADFLDCIQKEESLDHLLLRSEIYAPGASPKPRREAKFMEMAHFLTSDRSLNFLNWLNRSNHLYTAAVMVAIALDCTQQLHEKSPVIVFLRSLHQISPETFVRLKDNIKFNILSLRKASTYQTPPPPAANTPVRLLELQPNFQ